MSSRNTTSSPGLKRSRRDDVEVVDAAELWAFKRKRQQEDIEDVRAGRIKPAQLSWFTPENMRNVKIIDAPY
jgi:hypothetical protein